jgi:hypothetical protein
VLAVLFSLLLTLYLIIPEAIFRTIFGWYVPPKNFVISTGETAYRALLITILPLILAWTGSWYAPFVQTVPFSVRNQYRRIATLRLQVSYSGALQRRGIVWCRQLREENLLLATHDARKNHDGLLAFLHEAAKLIPSAKRDDETGVLFLRSRVNIVRTLSRTLAVCEMNPALVEAYRHICRRSFPAHRLSRQ